MKRILDAIEGNIKNENYYGALYISLSLIDACAKIENPTEKENGKRYKSWLDSFYLPLFEVNCSDPILPSYAIYKLRCSVLHESSNLINEEKLYKVILTTGLSHRNKATASNGIDTIHEIQLSIGQFINEIVESIKKWMNTKTLEQTTLDFAIETGRWSSATVGGVTAFKDCV